MKPALILIALLSLVVPPLRAVEADPRPHLLIIAGANTNPFTHSPGWPEILASNHPEWHIDVSAVNDRSVSEALAGLDNIIAPYPQVDAIILFFGTVESRNANFAKSNADALQKQLADLLEKLKANDRTKSATMIVMTPIPVIDARLDKFGQKDYSEKNGEAVADAFRKAASAGGASIIDVYTWQKSQTADEKAAPITGTLGWGLRDWGHPTLATYVSEQLEAIAIKPRDPAAFAVWKEQYEANRKLDQILSATGEGIVAAGEPLKTTGRKPLNKTDVITATVPVDSLADGSISFVIKSGDGTLTALSPGSEIRQFPDNIPRLKVTTESGEIVIPARGPDWQVIDEAEPETPQAPEKYRANIVKMRYFGVVSGEPQKRKWMLIRFDLAALNGKKPTAATVTLGYAPAIENLQISPTDVTMQVIEGPDRNWQSWTATWKTRDGKTGWTGGTPIVAERNAALKTFLAANPPESVAARAKAELEK